MRGQIVCSKAGRDKGYFMVVVSQDGEIHVFDGKQRQLELPKRKNAKHLSFTGTYLSEIDLTSNKKLRKALAVYKDKANFKEEL